MHVLGHRIGVRVAQSADSDCSVGLSEEVYKYGMQRLTRVLNNIIVWCTVQHYQGFRPILRSCKTAVRVR